MLYNRIFKIVLLSAACIGVLAAQSPVNQSTFISIEEEIPSGAVDGSNMMFFLHQDPNSVSSIAVYRNGLRLRRNLDYMANGRQITFMPFAIPITGDVLMCSYRASSPSATFITADTGTQGNWRTVYGTAGYAIPMNAAHYPAFVEVNLKNTPSWLWAAAAGTDTRALQGAVGLSYGRVSSAWGGYQTFTFDVNIIDGSSHQLAVYCLDWENVSRTQTIDILDASNNTVLSTQTVSDFSQGKYLIWTLTGHILLRVSVSGPTNAVISGLFFDL